MFAVDSTEIPMIESPCIKTCTLDARSGLCLGWPHHRRNRALDRYERVRARAHHAELPARRASRAESFSATE